MIESIHLKFFRKHEDLKVSFVDGLNVIRGPNETGKTTITEGIMYALGGANSLRNSVAETVTWGHKENELASTVVLRMSGKRYTFSRSPKGAECNYDGGKVTGQKEVTAFAATLFGADMKTASSLMMSSQAGLRGALDEGAAAVSSLMGKLADFDMIDRILDSAGKKLMLGSEDPVRVKLAAAEAEVVIAIASQPDPKAEETLAAKLKEVGDNLVVADALVGVLQVEMVSANQVVADGRQRQGSRESALSSLASLKTQLTTEQSQLERAALEAAKKPDEGRMTTLRAELADVGAARARLAAYSLFLATPKYPEVAWDEDQASFEAAMKTCTTNYISIQAMVSTIVGELKQIEAGRITNGKCPTCGSVKIDDEHVALKNAEVDAALKIKRETLEIWKVKLAEASSEAATMAEVEADARKIATHLAKVSSFIEIDASIYPVKACWKGVLPVAVDAGTRAAELASLEKQAQAATQAEGRVVVHRSAVADLVAKVALAERAVASLPAVEIEPLVAAYEESYRKYVEQSARVSDLRLTVADLTRQLSDLRLLVSTAAARLQTAQARVIEYQTDLTKLAFNNSLVKKIKGLRPVITDHLWNSVLAAVSNFFSMMRGEQSVVTKEGDGFRVNGKSIESLSGSTLDVLALAIRVALSKTFVPHVSFMLLDEPAHGCDNTRTSSLLGFMAGAGFDQTLLASHDELSESVANNVILLGE